ncbi:TPA: fumarylacetoacetate hydrolase family protein [Pseudomonas putida]|uniref:fumarylacetoacetate hydrolase family protein n=1 Tax=Pseudomonas putida TaxID=303 RepID=UPI001045CACB|nr:fumarylacetoacetate hydrolase family protein [Pseudomonas putida]MDD1993654.1 fumarylacetoacetate hydrolase family protein [Pseudomonas putida]HDS0916441.1 fumarylacetoacetate hydrolase family protein [Pseudomonas putida]HDS0932076.1 fumarylacetoacetate hydrolase family protein [Pseudomonas putida]HDS1781483.1 fumarylacetoacetate hydrolase family protein [Pseudomonas putida]HDS3797079.1 fumarylacetoacetate hydrolase family protein [Pseudomonas putida]
MTDRSNANQPLPLSQDASAFDSGSWVGRVWLADQGPAVVLVKAGAVYDISTHVATVSALLEVTDPVTYLRALPLAEPLVALSVLLDNSDPSQRDPRQPWLLAPIDLQAVKAAGVTFATSLLERVVEEQAKGDPAKADAIRDTLASRIGADLSQIVPGSAQAEALRKVLVEQGLWSQYLEVGIGPDAEVFTKAQPLSAVGHGAAIGIHPKSSWNNPEPEVVLAVSSDGSIKGAMLGNDVNLRDFEGRSALLLSKAKDNNASTALGPLLRLFDESFGLDDVRNAEVDLRVEGEDGFILSGRSSMRQISRDPQDLVQQTLNENHQYPDGMVLFLGTLFAPKQDRDQPGNGFTHKPGDVVTISNPQLGTLCNRVTTSDQAPQWAFGLRALIDNLGRRGLLEVAATARQL